MGKSSGGGGVQESVVTQTIYQNTLNHFMKSFWVERYMNRHDLTKPFQVSV